MKQFDWHVDVFEGWSKVQFDVVHIYCEQSLMAWK